MTYVDITVHVREDTPVRLADSSKAAHIVVGEPGHGVELALWDLGSCDRLLAALRAARERFLPDAAGAFPAPAGVAASVGTSSPADIHGVPV